jgi:RNA recognition motif-containing protein
MRLYIGGLPYQTTEQELRDLFSEVGQVTLATVITDRETGRSKGFGFVEMSTDEEGQSAIARFNGSLLGNRTITVDQAREREASRNRGGFQRNGNGGGYRNNRY